MEGKNQLISFAPLFGIVLFTGLAIFMLPQPFSFSKLIDPYQDFLSILLAFLSVLDMLLIYFIFLPQVMKTGQEHVALLLSEMPVIFGFLVSFLNNNGWAILPFSFLAFAQYFLIYQRINQSF